MSDGNRIGADFGRMTDESARIPEIVADDLKRRGNMSDKQKQAVMDALKGNEKVALDYMRTVQHMVRVKGKYLPNPTAATGLPSEWTEIGKLGNKKASDAINAAEIKVDAARDKLADILDKTLTKKSGGVPPALADLSTILWSIAEPIDRRVEDETPKKQQEGQQKEPMQSRANTQDAMLALANAFRQQPKPAGSTVPYKTIDPSAKPEHSHT